MIEVVTRAGWGARPAAAPAMTYPIKALALHWEGSSQPLPTDHSACAEVVRGVQRFHMVSRGWADIAYNWLVCAHGAAFEGRGWHYQAAANGNSTLNAGRPAICYLGGPVDPPITPAAQRAIGWLYQEARKVYRLTAPVPVVPHSALRATACPGDAIRSFIESHDWNQTQEVQEMPLTPDEIDAIARRAAQYTLGPADPALATEWQAAIAGWPNLSNQLGSVSARLDHLAGGHRDIASQVISLEAAVHQLAERLEVIAPTLPEQESLAEAVGRFQEWAQSLVAGLAEAFGRAK